MSLDAERVAGLARTKLQSLVWGAFPDITADAVSFNAGVGLAQGGQAFVYLIESAPSPLAAALAWGERQGASALHVIVDQPDPTLGAMARGLDPTPTLWQVQGAGLVEMETVPQAEPAAPSEAMLSHVPILRDAGCDVVVEHGVAIGEILGLEVARVVVEIDGSTTVRVGVGLYDQEAHALMHADASVEARLEQVVAEVRRHRRRAAGPHPLNRVARERWLRSLLVDEPSLVGLETLEVLAPFAPRGGIHEEQPAAAIGAKGDARVLVMTSTGIDLDLVPMAGVHVGAQSPDRVLLVLPARDHHQIIERMASHLAVPSALAAIEDPWPN